MAGLAHGIDVSNYAGQFNWAGTSGLSFGICRASQGLGAAGGTSNHDNDVFNGSAAELSAWIGSFRPQMEDEMQSGQLNTGANAVTVITVPMGSATNIAFGCDNSLQGMAPAVLRVAIYDTVWRLMPPVTVDSNKGQTVIPFTNPGRTGVISVRRQDAGEVVVGYEVS